MKTYNESVYTDVGGYDYQDILVKVNVPTPAEMQAKSYSADGEWFVIITNTGRDYGVALFSKGNLEAEYGMAYSGLSRKDAISNAAYWLVKSQY